MPERNATIVGYGLTEVGKVFGKTARGFAAEAVRLAVADAGLSLGDVDGLLVNARAGTDLNLTSLAPWACRTCDYSARSTLSAPRPPS